MPRRSSTSTPCSARSPTGFTNWADANGARAELGGAGPFPDAPLDVFGPGEESGTFDRFVEIVHRRSRRRASRSGQRVTRADYSQSANDNVIIEGIAGSDTSLGWVGYSFYASNIESLKAIGIETGDGCVAPTAETIADGSYGFSRSLYIYVNTGRAAENPALAAFVDFYLSDEGLATVTEAGYVDLPAERIEATRSAWNGWHSRRPVSTC